MTAPVDNSGQESTRSPDRDHASAAHDSPSGAIASEAPDGLCATLESLAQTGADRYDPVRFHYIAAMSRRATEQPPPVAAIVAQKAGAALQAYQRDFTQARQQTAVVVDELVAQFPESAERIQQLFASSDFRAVQRLATRLRRSSTRKLLAGLTEQIVSGETVAEPDKGASSFDDRLRQQELETLDSTLAKSSQGPTTPTGHASRELKAVRYFRESLVKVNADRLIRQAIDDLPDDSGPLNPQMLIIRTLAIMGELSPQYLQRFVSYLDTLLWLEQADQRSEPANAKKTGGKAGTKGAGRDQPLL